MSDQDSVEFLIDRLRSWLNESRRETSALDLAADSGEAVVTGFGIVDLVEEFTALKHEVKLQTKSGRGLVEQFEGALAALREAVDQVRQAGGQGDHPRSGRAMALALADLDEALERGGREIERASRRLAHDLARDLEAALESIHARRSWPRRLLLAGDHRAALAAAREAGLKQAGLFDSLIEGYGVIHKRLARVMAAERIVPIECEGRPVDPEQMTVVEVVDDPSRPPGFVVSVSRQGYMWNGRVLRCSEVRATRLAPRATPGERAPVGAGISS